MSGRSINESDQLSSVKKKQILLMSELETEKKSANTLKQPIQMNLEPGPTLLAEAMSGNEASGNLIAQQQVEKLPEDAEFLKAEVNQEPLNNTAKKDNIVIPLLAPIFNVAQLPLLAMKKAQLQDQNQKLTQPASEMNKAEQAIETALSKAQNNQTQVIDDDTSELATQAAGTANKEDITRQGHCFLVGPLQNNETIKYWNSKLEGHVNYFQLLAKDVEVNKKYLVYFPAAETFKQSEKNVIMLREHGINDLWLFHKGDMRGVISMGLFDKESRAIKLQEKYLNKGLRVKIVPRSKIEKQKYIQLGWAIDNTDVAAVIMDFKKQLPELSWQEYSTCPQPKTH